MAQELFERVDRKVGNLLNEVVEGKMGLPDLQRPFVWSDSKVRDLLELAGAKDTPKKTRYMHACDILGQVGLCAQDYIDRELDGTLSGGEMKRIEIEEYITAEEYARYISEKEYNDI